MTEEELRKKEFYEKLKDIVKTGEEQQRRGEKIEIPMTLTIETPERTNFVIAEETTSNLDMAKQTLEEYKKYYYNE